MKKLLLIFLRECVCLYMLAQGNLVPNYSLEVYDTCPPGNDGISGGEIYYSIPWFQPCIQLGNTTNSSSSDYFNACDTVQGVGTPWNTFGYQFANTGVAYAGTILFQDWPINNNYREYIEVKLIDTLIQNATYCVSFYISLANRSRYAINTLGCLFTTDSFLTSSLNQEIFLIPQIENTQGIITDTMNWVLVSGEFTASGGEQFLTIGNFRNDSNTSVMQVRSDGFAFAYYYIDDVSVTLCDTTAVEEFKIEDYKLKIYPNPASGNVTITAKSGNKIIITDITGRRIKIIPNFQNAVNFSADEIENGIYFISLLKNNRIIATRKFVVARY